MRRFFCPRVGFVKSPPEDKRFHPLSTVGVLTIPQEYCLRRRPPKSGKTARPRTHFCPSLAESFLPNGKRAPFPPASASLRLDNTARVLPAPQWRGSERKTARSRALLTPYVKRKLFNLVFGFVESTPEDKPFHPLVASDGLTIPQEYCLRRRPPKSGKTARPRTHFCPSRPEIFMQERKRAPFRPPLRFYRHS